MNLDNYSVKDFKLIALKDALLFQKFKTKTMPSNLFNIDIINSKKELIDFFNHKNCSEEVIDIFFNKNNENKYIYGIINDLMLLNNSQSDLNKDKLNYINKKY